MNLRQTAEVAALASMRAEEVIRHPDPVSTAALHRYWKASRLRLKCWFAGLRSVPVPLNGIGAPAPYEVRERVGLARSILVAEMLTRVWSAVLAARDAARSESCTQELVGDVFRGQGEARREVLRLLSDENRLTVHEAATIERLRQRIERWTDLLLGPLVQKYDVAQFTFDRQRAHESVLSPHRLGFQTLEGAMNPLTLIGLSRAIPRDHRDDQPRAALDWAVAQAVLSGLALTDGGTAREQYSEIEGSEDTSAKAVIDAVPPCPSSDAAADSVRGIRFAELRRSPHRRPGDAAPE